MSGILLDDLDGSKTRNIEQSARFDTHDCCYRLACEYMKSGNPSWPKVIHSIRNAGNTGVADELEKLVLK